MDALVERLRRTRLSAPDINGGRREVPLNPDGPAAAAALNALKEENERLRAQQAAMLGGGICPPEEGWQEMPPDPLVLENERLREVLHRIKRTAEMSEGIMKDRRRTGGWEGAEKVADQFRRIAALAHGSAPDTGSCENDVRPSVEEQFAMLNQRFKPTD